MREINILKSLHHPNIVHLNAVFHEFNEPHATFLIMEYVTFGPIMQRIVNQSSYLGFEYQCPLTNSVIGESLASKCFTQIVSAMAYLHSKNIAHRDLKIDNILIDMNSNIRIADFGVSHVFERKKKSSFRPHKTFYGFDDSFYSKDYFENTPEDESFVEDTVGTWAYWAPEMCDENVTEDSFSACKADVWAAGICLWIMIYGKFPFWGQDVTELFKNIAQAKPNQPHQNSEALNKVFTDCLTADFNQRPDFIVLHRYQWVQEHFDFNERLDQLNAIGDQTSYMSVESNPNEHFPRGIERKLSQWSNHAKEEVLSRQNTLNNLKLNEVKQGIEKHDFKLANNGHSPLKDFSSTVLYLIGSRMDLNDTQTSADSVSEKKIEIEVVNEKSTRKSTGNSTDGNGNSTGNSTGCKCMIM